MAPFAFMGRDGFHFDSCELPGDCRGGLHYEGHMSSQIWAIGPGNMARMSLAISGAGGPADPAALVNVDSTVTGGLR